MNIAVCTKDDIALSPLKDIIRADFPDAEFLICDPSALPQSPDKFHMILCDGEALLKIWQCEKLRSVYFPTDPLALVVPIDGKASIFFKSYTSKGAKLIGLSLDRSGTRSPMIPLFHSLEEITEDGTADDFLLYDVTTRKQVFNTRIRIDCVTLWPELTNNNMRLQGDITGQPGHDATADNSETGSAGDYNYYLPPGYLKNVEYSDNVVFMVQRPHLRWWSWGGDEIDITGDGYDVTFRLPPVPPGTYEVRFAYPGGVGNRGIAQVYFNGEAQGLPVDMTYGGTDSRVSGLYDGAAGIRQNRFTEEELEENARVMRNNGYYSCGRGQISYVSGDIPTGSGSWWNSSNTVLYDIAAMLRRRINDEYWIVNNPREDYIDVRFRSVTTGNANAAFVLDFIELVPTSICGPGGIGEDLN